MISNRASNAHRVDSVRNPEGHWINTSYFQEEANNFFKTGTYCGDPTGSPSWVDYWVEQLRRCEEGYEVGGVKITGHHYFYLNFCQIKVAEATKGAKGRSGKKTVKKPDFWDGDYNFFWALDIARYGTTVDELNDLQLHLTIDPLYLDGGRHVIVGKSRRKGYSYKNAAICANVYNTIPNSTTILGAFDKKYLYPEGTMNMTGQYLDLLNKNTAWKKARDFVNKQEHKKASYEKRENGIITEGGYKSQVIALTFKDNPDAARGKDAEYVIFEEAGKFPNLKDSYNATKATSEAGTYMTGQMIVFGTGGDMESGTLDFSQMFYSPLEYDAMPFTNIWDENAENSNCSFFHPVNWNMEGYYDEQGNSEVVGAKEHELGIRAKLIKNSTSSLTLQARVQEYPLNPSEAFLTVSTNDFPIIELRNRLNLLRRENLHLIKGQAVHLIRDKDGKVTAIPDLKGELHPIWDLRPKTQDLNGAPVIFEYPKPNCPKGAYKIGFDPYRQDKGTSLASIYVWKTVIRGDYVYNQIVAMYVGRMYSAESVNRIFEMFIELYNTEGMFENEVTHVLTYFKNKKKLHLLAAQPDKVISKSIENSKVQRIYGCHMNDQLKDSGEKYIKEMLLQERDRLEDGTILTNIDYIFDPGLLESLIEYNRKGNFDRVMSLMQVMFQVEEDEEDKEYNSIEVQNNAMDLLELMNNQFGKNN
jgi:hypothetical protein